MKVASTIESASKVNGVIAIDAEGSVDVKSCTFSDYTDVEDEYESALASGPMLLMEGKVCSFSSRCYLYTTYGSVCDWDNCSGKNDAAYY